MFSPILTKVNTVSLPFNKRIGLTHVADERLIKFVKHCHSNTAEIIQRPDNCIEVFTTKGQYIYSCLSGQYFQRVDANKLTKKWYIIS